MTTAHHVFNTGAFLVNTVDGIGEDAVFALRAGVGTCLSILGHLRVRVLKDGDMGVVDTLLKPGVVVS